MIKITFTIDGTEYRIETEPAQGHPRQIYNKGSQVVEKIETEGYEFVGPDLEYQELSRAHRKSGDSELVPLGDLSNRVKEVAADEVNSDSEKGEDHDEGDIVIELIGPDGYGIDREYQSSQSLAQVKADLQQYHEINRTKSINLYRSQNKKSPLDPSTSVTDFDGATLYWDLTDLG